jgi:hypothetical protein
MRGAQCRLQRRARTTVPDTSLLLPAPLPVQSLQVRFKDDVTKLPSGKQCVLQCKQCGDMLAPSNVSRVGNTHFDVAGRCKKEAKQQDRVKRLRCSSDSGTLASGDPSSRAGSSAHGEQRAMTGFLATPQQREVVIRHLTRFLCKRSTPAAIEDDDLRRCFAEMGIDLPGQLAGGLDWGAGAALGWQACPAGARTVRAAQLAPRHPCHACAAGRTSLCNTHIPALYDAIREELMAQLKPTATGVLCGLSTDGWRKKTAEQGVPLVNVNVLLPEGGSFFYRVLPARGVVKDAAWIAAQHLEVAAEITGGKPERLIGVVQDNTSANRKAMELLQEQQPKCAQGVGVGWQPKHSCVGTHFVVIPMPA